MLDGVPQCPFYEPPLHSLVDLDLMARRLLASYATVALTRGSTPMEWHALMRAAVPQDLQAAQHWDNVAMHDATAILRRVRQWTLEKRELGWAAFKLVTGDIVPLPGETFEVRVERNGAIYRREVCCSIEIARARLAEMRRQLVAAGWSLLAPQPSPRASGPS